MDWKSGSYVAGGEGELHTYTIFLPVITWFAGDIGDTTWYTYHSP